MSGAYTGFVQVTP